MMIGEFWLRMMTDCFGFDALFLKLASKTFYFFKSDFEAISINTVVVHTYRTITCDNNTSRHGGGSADQRMGDSADRGRPGGGGIPAPSPGPL
jgi:hypothetical protein